MTMTNAVASAEEPLFARIRTELYSAVLGDVMEAIGLTRQFLPPEIRALVPGTVHHVTIIRECRNAEGRYDGPATLSGAPRQ